MSAEIDEVDLSIPDIKEQMAKKELLSETSINEIKDEKDDFKKENETKSNNKDCNDNAAEIRNKKEDLETKESKKSNDEVSVKEVNSEVSKDQNEKDKDVDHKNIISKETSKKEASDKEASSKEATIKQASEVETSKKEAGDKVASKKETSNKVASKKEASVKVASKKEVSDREDRDKEASDKEGSDIEASDKEASNKEDSDSDEGNTSQAKESDETMNIDKSVSTPTCRARKKVERLELGFSSTKKEKVEIPEGSGQKLGECPMIESQVTKHNILDLKLLHKILFNRPGSVHEIKRNIRKFCGFCFKKDSSEYEQKKHSLDRYKMSELKKVCEILGLERSGSKDDIEMRMLTFLMEPKDSGKAPKKKSSSRDKKKKTEKTPKATKKNAKKEDSSDEEDNEKDSHANDEDDKSDEESDNEKKKSNNSKGKKTPAKTKPVKKEKVKKEPAKGTKRKKEVQADSSDDDEPISKKSKTPTDNEIKKLVKQILEKADLQEITMKKVIKQVYDTYPDCDLTSKKTFIKTTIKSVIVSL